MNEDPIKGYHCDLDCSNSPKAQFIKDFNSWFMTEDTERILSVLTPDIEWEMVGEEPIIGIDAVRRSFFTEVEGENRPAMAEMTVEGIITHGREAASYGSMSMSDGTKYKFTDIVEFKDLSKTPLVRKIISFVIEIK